jgi:hypothetical protein
MECGWDGIWYMTSGLRYGRELDAVCRYRASGGDRTIAHALLPLLGKQYNGNNCAATSAHPGLRLYSNLSVAEIDTLWGNLATGVGGTSATIAIQLEIGVGTAEVLTVYIL